MIRTFTDFPLKKLHTFGNEASAKYFFEFTEPEDLPLFLSTNQKWQNLQILILGEGSNLLFVDDFPGLVIHPNVPGIQIVNEDRNHIWLQVGAGVVWDQLVEFAVFHNWGGIENLSLIPGKVGASAVQNIGAYGMEIQHRVVSVRGFDLETECEYDIEGYECQFAYRDSIFKKLFKNRFIITSVVYKLDKFPEYILHYGDLKAETEKLGKINLRNIRQTVIRIRESKLPDPAVVGNAGSFFKNPIVETIFAEEMLDDHPAMPHYPATEGKIKLAAGWLIEQCGWKGFRRGDVGVHEKQALVLVNYGNATGREIYDLSEEIKQSVHEKFGVTLEREVNVIGGK
jgi:UDP-N-acetylmuramate dehydrogenase